MYRRRLVQISAGSKKDWQFGDPGGDQAVARDSRPLTPPSALKPLKQIGVPPGLKIREAISDHHHFGGRKVWRFPEIKNIFSRWLCRMAAVVAFALLEKVSNFESY